MTTSHLPLATSQSNFMKTITHVNQHAIRQLDAAFNALLQEIIEPLVIKELHASLEQLKEDRRLRAEGKGMAIFVVNKPKDLKKIDGLIKAMQTVVSYYSRPF